MKNKDFARLANSCCQVYPGFPVKAPMMFIRPVKHTLRGIYFESHSYEAGYFTSGCLSYRSLFRENT